MFGNELRYHTIDGHAEFIEFLEKLNPMKIIRQFLSGNVMYPIIFGWYIYDYKVGIGLANNPLISEPNHEFCFKKG